VLSSEGGAQYLGGIGIEMVCSASLLERRGFETTGPFWPFRPGKGVEVKPVFGQNLPAESLGERALGIVAVSE
jgi:hypothetical protein